MTEEERSTIDRLSDGLYLAGEGIYGEVEAVKKDLNRFLCYYCVCPVCEDHFFQEVGDYSYCPICKWENDYIQYLDHDFAGGANVLSVNEDRLFYKLSQQGSKN